MKTPKQSSASTVVSASDVWKSRRFKVCVLSALLLGALAPLTSLAEYRTKPTASKRADLQVGVGFSTADSDHSQRNFRGISGYATFDATPHFGLELMFHQVNTPFDDQQYERTYEIGPRYVRHYGRFNPYVRPAYGRGVFNFPNSTANLAYNMFTIAGGVDVHVLRHVNARAEYEAQHWLGFPPNGLSPSVITFGAAYHF